MKKYLPERSYIVRINGALILRIKKIQRDMVRRTGAKINFTEASKRIMDYLKENWI